MKNGSEVKIPFKVVVYKIIDDLIYPEAMKVVDWDFDDGFLRIYVKELEG